MTDHFVVLSEPRRPWLEVEPLKAKFLTLSGKAHPDRAKDHREREAAVHRFAEINAAYNCLRDTKERLHHLYVIETGNEARQVRQVPPAIADLIIPAEQLCREVSAFLIEKARATSPLVQARHFEQGLEWTERIQTMQLRLRTYREQLDVAVQSLNPAWEAVDSVHVSRRAEKLPLMQLEEFFRAYSYVTRFQQQLQERLVQLAL
ncbi:MAG TPA: DnaJ domain-containing protein [Verrucomicrobiae bacterium]|jgi:curved DNA-binding protein CbpA